MVAAMLTSMRKEMPSQPISRNLLKLTTIWTITAQLNFKKLLLYWSVFWICNSLFLPITQLLSLHKIILVLFKKPFLFVILAMSGHNALKAVSYTLLSVYTGWSKYSMSKLSSFEGFLLYRNKRRKSRWKFKIIFHEVIKILILL